MAKLTYGETAAAAHSPAWLLAGGIAYTVGAVLYGIAGKGGHHYMHSVFHIFVVAGSILQYFCILFYVL